MTCMTHTLDPVIKFKNSCPDCMVENLNNQIHLHEKKEEVLQEYVDVLEQRNDKLTTLNEESLQKLKDTMNALQTMMAKPPVHFF